MKAIGLELKGKSTFDENGCETYYPSEEEKEQMLQGKIAVVGTTTYHYNFGKGEAAREHDYTIVNMDTVSKISIFYDTEDDYMMSQTFHLKSGSTLFGMSRNHEEVEKWESLGIPISKGYGW